MEIRLSGGRGKWIDKFWMTTLFTVLKYVLKSPLMMNIFTSLGQFYFRTIICYVFFLWYCYLKWCELRIKIKFQYRNYHLCWWINLIIGLNGVEFLLIMLLPWSSVWHLEKCLDLTFRFWTFSYGTTVQWKPSN